MTLDDYLKTPGALSVASLREAIGAKSDAQVQQWRFKWGGRTPGPANCVAIEAATDGKVRRWDLRPDDWHLIWPELRTKKGAPPIATEAA